MLQWPRHSVQKAWLDGHGPWASVQGGTGPFWGVYVLEEDLPQNHPGSIQNNTVDGLSYYRDHNGQGLGWVGAGREKRTGPRGRGRQPIVCEKVLGKESLG